MKREKKKTLDLHANDAGGCLFRLEAHRGLHSQQVGYGIEVVRLAVLLSHLLLDELVPVVVGETPAGRTGKNAIKYNDVNLFNTRTYALFS